MTGLSESLLPESLFSQFECALSGAHVSERCGGSEALKGRGSLLFYVRPNLLVKVSLYSGEVRIHVIAHLSGMNHVSSSLPSV